MVVGDAESEDVESRRPLRGRAVVADDQTGVAACRVHNGQHAAAAAAADLAVTTTTAPAAAHLP